MDATFESSHNVVPADVDGDGDCDLVAAEQEQSPGKRVSVFLNDGSGGFTQEVLSTGSGHDPVVADVDGDGRLDILNSPHGFFGAPRVLTLFLNRS